MSKYIKITGDDLAYFKTLVQQGLEGGYGELTEVRLVFNEDNGIMLGTNGHTSDFFGELDRENSDREIGSQPERLDSLLNRIEELLPQLARVTDDLKSVDSR